MESTAEITSSDEIDPNQTSLLKSTRPTVGFVVANASAACTVTFVVAELTSVPPRLADTGRSTATAGAVDSAAAETVPTVAHESTVRDAPPLNATLVENAGIVEPVIVASSAPIRIGADPNPNRPAESETSENAIDATGASGSVRSTLMVNPAVSREPVSSCGSVRNERERSELSPPRTPPQTVGLACVPRSTAVVFVPLASIETASSSFVAVPATRVTVGVTVTVGAEAPAVVAVVPRAA